jgi:hypothetical protein
MRLKIRCDGKSYKIFGSLKRSKHCLICYFEQLRTILLIMMHGRCSSSVFTHTSVAITPPHAPRITTSPPSQKSCTCRCGSETHRFTATAKTLNKVRHIIYVPYRYTHVAKLDFSFYDFIPFLKFQPAYKIKNSTYRHIIRP